MKRKDIGIPAGSGLGRSFAAFAFAALLMAMSVPVRAQIASDPVSVVFIIDNSESMSGMQPVSTPIGNPVLGSQAVGNVVSGNDAALARFTLVASLLDTLNAASPGCEAALIPFTRRLAFDDRDDAFFKAAFPQDTAQHDAFVPLTALNKVFSNGRTGLDTLKELLAHTPAGDLTHATLLPASRNNSGMGRANLRDGSDMTLGFQAAVEALKDAKASKERQVIIFISDGEPSTPDDSRAAFVNDFMRGEGVPKTLAIFAKDPSASPAPPQAMVEMTANIKANGYSSGNPSSALWSMNLPGPDLLDLLKMGVLGSGISSLRPGAARQAGFSGYRLFHQGLPGSGAFDLFTARGRWLGAASFPIAAAQARELDRGGAFILRSR